MLRTKSILFVLNVAFLALNCMGQMSGGSVYTTPPCNESMVGLTFALDTPLYYGTCKNANTPLILPCPEGSGYKNNGTVAGCVPWALWDCTYKGGPPACTATQQMSKYPNMQPNLYWTCVGLNVSQAYACPDGSAFIASGADAGCKPWCVWSAQCPN